MRNGLGIVLLLLVMSLMAGVWIRTPWWSKCYIKIGLLVNITTLSRINLREKHTLCVKDLIPYSVFIAPGSLVINSFGAMRTTGPVSDQQLKKTITW